MANAFRTMAVLVAVAAAGHAQTPGVDTFLTQLQRASQANDRNAIAAMIRYPITILIGGLRVPFANAASFLERYEDIFNPPLRDAIARASLRPQTDRVAMTVTQDEYAIGTNFIVIAAVEGQLRITSITVPHFATHETPVVPLVENSKSPARRQEPRRVAIRIGPRPTQIPGLLGRDATDVFILFLPKGKLADVRLTRMPAGAAVLRVVHARTGTPLGARTSADGRFVSGRPAEDADYRIEVHRIGNGDAMPLPYMLSLSLR
jgi:hypothetical protein